MQWIKFHALAICLYYVPLSFPFDSPISALLGALLEKSNNIKTVWEESSDSGAFHAQGHAGNITVN